MRNVILALDLGGTKLNYALFKYPPSQSTDPPIFQETLPTKRGISKLCTKFKLVLSHVQHFIDRTQYQLHPIVSLGTPGKLIGESGHILAPGSATNLESFPGEFDHLNLHKTLGPLLPEGVELIIRNDAINQMQGGILQLIAGGELTLDKMPGKLAYIGPGTGLGGGFGSVDENGELIPVTDGHIYDILIETAPGQHAGAQAIFSGKTVLDTLRQHPKDINQSTDLYTRHEPYFKTLGTYLAKLCIAIHEGKIKKEDPQNNWSTTDINAVTGTRHFLIGGSLGTKGAISAIIRDSAAAYLKEADKDLTLLKIPDSDQAALIGAVAFAQRKPA